MFLFLQTSDVRTLEGYATRCGGVLSRPAHCIFGDVVEAQVQLALNIFALCSQSLVLESRVEVAPQVTT